MKHASIYLICLSAALPTFSGCEKTVPEFVERNLTITDLPAKVIMPYADASRVGTVIFQTRQKMDPLHALFDPFEEHSEISTVNTVTGSSRIPVSRDTIRLLKHALQFGKISDGAFDITTPPLSALWGFGGALVPITPLPESVRRAALKSVGYDKIDLQENSVLLTSPYTQIDVSCLTQSYAMDIAVLQHRSQQIPSLYLQIGNDTRVLGERAPGEPWTQPLILPGVDLNLGSIRFGELPAAHLELPSDEYVTIEGKKYYNNINPRTGNAVDHNGYIFTAGKSATKAAALGHALMSLEVSEAKELLLKFNDCVALIIPRRDPIELWLSPGGDHTFSIDPAYQKAIHWIIEPETPALLGR